MKEKPYEPLLERELQVAYVKEYFSDIIDVMRDMTNYGTNLIVRCFATGERKLEDAIILGVIVRQAVAMFDAFEILVSNAAVYPAHLQARALFEASLYLQWILKDDTAKKAKHYYVSNVRQEKLWALRTQVGSAENIVFEQAIAPFGSTFSKTTKGLESEGKKYLEEINRVLSQKEFQKINEAIDKYEKDKKLKFGPAWYAPLGIPTVRQLAIKLERLHEYEIFYSMSSDVMHLSKHKSHVKFEGNEIHFQPIRYLEGI